MFCKITKFKYPAYNNLYSKMNLKKGLNIILILASIIFIAGCMDVLTGRGIEGTQDDSSPSWQLSEPGKPETPVLKGEGLSTIFIEEEKLDNSELNTILKAYQLVNEITLNFTYEVSKSNINSSLTDGKNITLTKDNFIILGDSDVEKIGLAPKTKGDNIVFKITSMNTTSYDMKDIPINLPKKNVALKDTDDFTIEIDYTGDKEHDIADVKKSLRWRRVSTDLTPKASADSTDHLAQILIWIAHREELEGTIKIKPLNITSQNTSYADGKGKTVSFNVDGDYVKMNNEVVIAQKHGSFVGLNMMVTEGTGGIGSTASEKNQYSSTGAAVQFDLGDGQKWYYVSDVSAPSKNPLEGKTLDPSIGADIPLLPDSDWKPVSVKDGIGEIAPSDATSVEGIFWSDSTDIKDGKIELWTVEGNEFKMAESFGITDVTEQCSDHPLREEQISGAHKYRCSGPLDLSGLEEGSNSFIFFRTSEGKVSNALPVRIGPKKSGKGVIEFTEAKTGSKTTLPWSVNALLPYGVIGKSDNNIHAYDFSSLIDGISLTPTNKNKVNYVTSLGTFTGETDWSTYSGISFGGSGKIDFSTRGGNIIMTASGFNKDIKVVTEDDDYITLSNEANSIKGVNIFATTDVKALPPIITDAEDLKIAVKSNAPLIFIGGNQFQSMIESKCGALVYPKGADAGSAEYDPKKMISIVEKKENAGCPLLVPTGKNPRISFIKLSSGAPEKVSAAEAPVGNETQIPAGSQGAMGVTIEQIDFDLSGLKMMDSNFGRLTVSPEYYGYLNMYTDIGWVVRNLYLNNMLTTTYFDLGNRRPLDITTLSAYIDVKDEPQPIFSDGPRAIYVVGNKIWDAEGIVAQNIPEEKPVTGPRPAMTGGDMFVEIALPPPPAAVVRPNYTHSLPSVSNKEAADNQCVPMSVANSLQYLEDAKNIKVPDEHKEGLKGDDSLAGKLDTEMNRTVVSRRSGNGVGFEDMLEGKFSYLKKKGLDGKLINKHQGRGYGGTAVPNGNFTSNGITSRDDGNKVTFEWLCQQIKEGEDVEIIFSYEDAAGSITGGHAVRVFECGETLGVPWIGFAHDSDQSNDTEGLETPRENVIDSDGDGALNIFGNSSEIVFAVSESALPPEKGFIKKAWEGIGGAWDWLTGLFS